MPTAPSPLDAAILRTVLYADVFDYALTLAEIQHYLIEQTAAPSAVSAALDESAWLAQRLTRTGQYVTLPQRAHLAALRDGRRRVAELLWPRARRWAARLSALPFVRMVAVTGALAMDNAPANDDIDFLIVTEPGRVWLTRALAVGLVYLARLGGVGLCPNYVLSTRALAQDRQDLFTAHDLLQMIPLAGLSVYETMRAANRWADSFLPNAVRPLRCEADLSPRGLTHALQRLGEWLLSGAFGTALENWERARKQKKFASAARASSAAQLDADRVKGHFRDNGQPILHAYTARLTRHLPPEA